MPWARRKLGLLNLLSWERRDKFSHRLVNGTWMWLDSWRGWKSLLKTRAELERPHCCVDMSRKTSTTKRIGLCPANHSGFVLQKKGGDILMLWCSHCDAPLLNMSAAKYALITEFLRGFHTKCCISGQSGAAQRDTGELIMAVSWLITARPSIQATFEQLGSCEAAYKVVELEKPASIKPPVSVAVSFAIERNIPPFFVATFQLPNASCWRYSSHFGTQLVRIRWALWNFPGPKKYDE